MLRFSDSRNFSRTLAAIGLIAGPLLFAIEALLDPAWASDSAEYLAEVADDKGRYIAAGAAGTIGSLLFIPGLLGVMRLFRGRSVTLGQIAAGLLTVGVIGLSAILAFNGFDVILADHADRAAAVEIYDELDDSGALIAYFLFFFFIGIVLGSILLAIALFRRRIVPIWSPDPARGGDPRRLPRRRGVGDRQRDLVPHPHGRAGPAGDADLGAQRRRVGALGAIARRHAYRGGGGSAPASAATRAAIGRRLGLTRRGVLA